MTDLTRAEIEGVAYNFSGADEAITQLDDANARVGAALREAATEGAGLVDGNVEAASVYGAILARAPDATAALDRALERMRDALNRQCDNMAFIVNHVTLPEQWRDKFAVELEQDRRALPLHEEPNNDAG